MAVEQALNGILAELNTNQVEPGVQSGIKVLTDAHPDLVEQAYNLGVRRFGGKETAETIEQKLESAVRAAYPTDVAKQESLAAVVGDLSRAGYEQAWNDFSKGKNVTLTTTDNATGEKLTETLLRHDEHAPGEVIANIKLRAGLSGNDADDRLNKLFMQARALSVSAGGKLDETTMMAVAAEVSAANQKSETLKNATEKAGGVAGTIGHTSVNIVRKAAKTIIMAPAIVAGATVGTVVASLRSGTRLFTQHSVRTNAKRLMGEAGSAAELQEASDVLKKSRGHNWLIGAGAGGAAGGLGASKLVNVPFNLAGKLGNGAGSVAGTVGKGTLKLFGADWDGPSMEQMEAERLAIQAGIEAGAKIRNPQITPREVEAALAPTQELPVVEPAKVLDPAAPAFASAARQGELASTSSPQTSQDKEAYSRNLESAADYNERLAIARQNCDVVPLSKNIGQAAVIAADKVEGIDEVKAKRDVISAQLGKDPKELEVVEIPGKDGKIYFAIKGITGPEATAAYAQAQAEERARTAGANVASTMTIPSPGEASATAPAVQAPVDITDPAKGRGATVDAKLLDPNYLSQIADSLGVEGKKALGKELGRALGELMKEGKIGFDGPTLQAIISPGATPARQPEPVLAGAPQSRGARTP